ncbi:MAG TPA: redoxin domain-containing protein, partial [Pyrinomonadaceae bacterium]|nr:redoxin domain-containing protein [Pyrinomonadaceae bacterium]
MFKLRTLFVVAAAALLMLALSSPLVRAQGGHEYAPVVEKTINYKDWTFKSLKEGAGKVNLREWAKGKKLVMVVYFAPWCGNWKMEAPVVARLLEKYKAHGFDVVAVSEYAA